MLLSYQLDKGIIKIGNQNRIKELNLKEIKHQLNEMLLFAGQIKWIYKKKNNDTELEQNITAEFKLTDINKKRIPYKIV